MNTIISPENKLQNILDFYVCKKLLQDAINKNESCVILCPHYSINIASKYEDGEELQWDLEELSDYLENYVSVSDYDDLIVELTYEDSSILEYTLPDYLACYLINGDSEGLTEKEIKEIDQFLTYEKIEILDMKDDSSFYHSNDLNGLGANCSTYTARAIVATN